MPLVQRHSANGEGGESGAQEFDEWRQEKGVKLSRSTEAIRNRSINVLLRLAAMLPERPSRTVVPDEDVAWATETISVETFAHAIGKSPRTVYRMVRDGQLFSHREGAGRGTVLIYCDQVDPANRPHASASDKVKQQSA